jgi:hypothetical protein
MVCPTEQSYQTERDHRLLPLSISSMNPGRAVGPIHSNFEVNFSNLIGLMHTLRPSYAYPASEYGLLAVMIT